jgi:hypothetical protein
MKVRVPMLVVACAVAWTSCTALPGEAPPATSPDLVGPAGLAAPPPLWRTSADTLEDCSAAPPPVLTPSNGAVVSGSIVLSAPLLEGPCSIAATVVFRVKNASGTVVLDRCDNDLPAHVTWDTRAVKNGVYTIHAHRACHCIACELHSTVTVTVTNPG